MLTRGYFSALADVYESHGKANLSAALSASAFADLEPDFTGGEREVAATVFASAQRLQSTPTARCFTRTMLPIVDGVSLNRAWAVMRALASGTATLGDLLYLRAEASRTWEAAVQQDDEDGDDTSSEYAEGLAIWHAYAGLSLMAIRLSLGSARLLRHPTQIAAGDVVASLWSPEDGPARVQAAEPVGLDLALVLAPESARNLGPRRVLTDDEWFYIVQSAALSRQDLDWPGGNHTPPRLSAV